MDIRLRRARWHTSTPRQIGILTRTIVPTPVIHTILYAKLGAVDDLGHAVLVSAMAVQIKAILDRGHLSDMLAKDDFDCHILAAGVVSVQDTSAQSAISFLKLENPDTNGNGIASPSQLIVLLLDSNDLVFLCLRHDSHGQPFFLHCTRPIPVFEQLVHQPMAHLAIDPKSRAIAVAAHEQEIIIFPTRSFTTVQHALTQTGQDWCPVGDPYPIQIRGKIQKMEFLVPKEDLPDQIVLLLIVLHERRTKAVHLEWTTGTIPQWKTPPPGQPLGEERLCNLLIPCNNASFLLVSGSELVLCSGLLSGSIKQKVMTIDLDPIYPGESRGWPIFTAYTRPARTTQYNRGQDTIYLIREDGQISLLDIKENNINVENAGHLERHVGTGFASLGNLDTPDILIAAGEGSDGKEITIGTWPHTNDALMPITRLEALTPVFVAPIPNWSPVRDIVASETARSKRERSKGIDSVYIASGQQPFGYVTELRRGIEGFLQRAIELDELSAVTDAWMLPDFTAGSMIMILSLPTGTRLFRLTAMLAEIEELGSQSIFTGALPTICAGVTATHQLVHIVEDEICVSSVLTANFEDTVRLIMEPGMRVINACLLPHSQVAITSIESGVSYRIVAYRLPKVDEDNKITACATYPLDKRPVCMTAILCDTCAMVYVGLEDGCLLAIALTEDGVVRQLQTIPSSATNDPTMICDQMVILRHNSHAAYALICGRRNGDLLLYHVTSDHSQPLNIPEIIAFGYATVKLVDFPDDPTRACAMSGHRTSLISLSTNTSSALDIHNIWVTEKDDPGYNQGMTLACAQLPDAQHLQGDTFAGDLLLISRKFCQIVTLNRAITAIPCRTPVSGTPTKVAQIEAYRCLACVSLCASEVGEERRSSNGMGPMRIIQSTIDFVSTNSSRSITPFKLKPGQNVNAMIELTLEKEEGKVVSYVMIGCGDTRGGHGHRKGFIRFLVPEYKTGAIEKFEKLSWTERFDDEILALSSYDMSSYVACSRKHVYLYRLQRPDHGRREWESICAPFELSSPASWVMVTTTADDERLIAVSTKGDSLITLILKQVTTNNNPASHPRYYLQPIAMTNRDDFALSHLPLTTSDLTSTSASPSNLPTNLILQTTKDAQILGLSHPTATSLAQPTSTTIHFAALLPQSLIRIISQPTPRTSPPPPGILPARLIGAAADGALTAIALLEPGLWRRLFWLQRLVEWSPRLSPFGAMRPNYCVRDSGDSDEETGGVGGGGYGNVMDLERMLPVGLSEERKRGEEMDVDGGSEIGNGNSGDEAVLHTALDPLNDGHVDGDVLVRVLKPEGREAVVEVLKKSEGDDTVGTWVRAHLEEEIDAVDEMIEMMRRIERCL